MDDFSVIEIEETVALMNKNYQRKLYNDVV